MKPTTRLWQYSARVTLFTRANCSLCETAKRVVTDLQQKREFEYREIDIMREGQEAWKDIYEFDTPVVDSRVSHPVPSLIRTATCPAGVPHIFQA